MMSSGIYLHLDCFVLYFIHTAYQAYIDSTIDSLKLRKLGMVTHIYLPYGTENGL